MITPQLAYIIECGEHIMSNRSAQRALLVFNVVGDLSSLAMEEAKGLLEAYSLKYRIIYKDRFLIIFEVSDQIPENLPRRFSLIKSINKFWGIYDNIRDLQRRAKEISHLFDGKRFHVRVHKLGPGWQHVNSTKLAGKIGKIIILNSNKSRVVFDNPDVILNVFLSEKIVLGTLIGSRDQSIFKRQPSKRPFSLPISMEPRVARAMVNMARLREGQTLLDPFCGTGGILIEAGLMGIKIFGSDIDERMVKGTIRNLEFYGIKPEKIVKCDVRDVDEYFNNIDGIVCDPPYGRSASTFGERSTRLYEDSFKAFKKVLKAGGYVVISFPTAEHHLKIGTKYMKLKTIISYRVHKSLTRYIGVYQNLW